MKHIILGAVLLLLPLISVSTRAQLVSTTPNVVELTEGRWAVDLKVKNLASRPARVQVGVVSRVIRSDAYGNLYPDSAATWDEMSRSCAAWLKVAPRELTLPANSWRTLRVEISSPGSLSSGEFWGNLVLTSDAGGNGIIASTDSSTTFASIQESRDLSVPIMVRKGEVTSGLELGAILAIPRMKGAPAGLHAREQGTVVLIDARRLGNGAYRGTLTAMIRRENGSEVATNVRNYSLLWDRRLRLEFPQLKNGSYILEVAACAQPQGPNQGEAIAPPLVKRNVRLMVSGERIEVVDL